MKKVIVLSLGGSQIIPDDVNSKYLNEFKKTVIKHKTRYKFIIVCGGGSIARIYIDGLKNIGSSEKLQSFAGISVTRTNARFMSYFFGSDNEEGIAHTMQEIKEMLKNFLTQIPMGRMGDPDDIGKVALFLASDMSSYLTGTQIVVDGGVLLS